MKMQYQVPQKLADICDLFGVTRQAYYKKQKHDDNLLMHEEIVIQMVEDLRKIPQWQRTGTDKLHRKLTPDFIKMGFKMGRVALNELLFANGLLVRKRRSKVRTTDSYHHYKVYQNKIKEMVIDRPGMVWVCDITYLDNTDCFAYLFLITDAYSRKIVGYSTKVSLAAIGAVEAAQMAANQWTAPGADMGLIHHSDRGSQYCCKDYVAFLQAYKIDISMAAKGNPYENAIAERINGVLKQMGLDRTFATFEDVENAVIETINVYNNERLHSSIDFMTPSEAHKKTGELKRRWKTKKYSL
jgi:transposase InsO family protein